MLKRSWVLALGIGAVAALCWSNGAVAMLATNLIAANGFSPTGLTSNAMTLRAVRLALPDGTELMFR
jgi:hypothetical protein